MQTKQRTNTEAMVDCVNRINTAANEIELDLRETFAPLVGKQVFRNDNTFMKKYEHLKPSVNTRNAQIWHHKSDYELCFQVKGSENGKHGNYHSTHISIGKVVHGVLVEIHTDKSDRRTDWTVEEVEAARIAIHEAEEELNKAKRSLGPFELHDYR